MSGNIDSEYLFKDFAFVNDMQYSISLDYVELRLDEFNIDKVNHNYHKFFYELKDRNTFYSIEFHVSSKDTNVFTAGVYDVKNNWPGRLQQFSVDKTYFYNFVLGDNIPNMQFFLYTGIRGKAANHEMHVKKFIIRKAPLSQYLALIGGSAIDSMLFAKKADMMWRYHDAIDSSTWFSDKSVVAGSGMGECSYNYLYPLYRVLNEFKPASILELGMNQCTKMTAQYVSVQGAGHLLLDYDRSWVDFFLKGWNKFSKNTKAFIISFKKVKAAIEYDNLGKYLGINRFNLLLFKCPRDGYVLSYKNILDKFPYILADDFAVFVDHAEQSNEHALVSAIEDKLLKENISCVKCSFVSGDREVVVIASDSWKFIKEF